jgi:hypothetical protein
MALLLFFMPKLFAIVQQRQGSQLTDPLLSVLPSANLSWPIFLAIYSLGLLYLYRCIAEPVYIFMFLKAYALITSVRFVCMLLWPLEPPAGLVTLTDPLTQIFYGGTVITKDLFFSGHTSTMFMIYLLLRKPTDKLIAAAITLFIAAAVLIQHVHYTIDVLVAFPATWLLVQITEANILKIPSAKKM